MDSKVIFIIEHWEKKSNAILGFVVIQSILLADKLASEEFIIKIKSIRNLMGYLLSAHSFIALSGVIMLILIDAKVAKKLRNNQELRKDIELHFTLLTKIILTILFGLIPIFIFVKNMS